MKIKAIIGRVFSAKNNINAKTTKSAVNTRTEQELIDKRVFLSAFLRNESMQENNYKQTVNDELLTGTKIEDLMHNFGNNLTKIKTFLGAYGLAAYAQVSPQAVIKSNTSNIVEHEYSTNKTVKYAFCEYLLKNDTGSVEDIHERFGEGGKFLLNKYINRGLILLAQNGGYHIPGERLQYIALTAGGNEGAFPNINSYDRYRYYRYDL